MRRQLSIFGFRFAIYDLRSAIRGLRAGEIANLKSRIVNAAVLALALSLVGGVHAAGGTGISDLRSKIPDLRSATSAPASEKPSDLPTADGKSRPGLNSGANRTLNSIQGSKGDEPVYVIILSFVSKLAVVLALAYATIYALKRFTGFKNAIGAGRRRIKVVENASLGANRSLHLVEVGSKRLLVASTPSQINLLAEVRAEDIPETSTPEPAAIGFKDQLSAFVGSKPDTGDAAANIARVVRGSSAFLQEKIMHLGRLRRKLQDG